MLTRSRWASRIDLKSSSSWRQLPFPTRQLAAPAFQHTRSHWSDRLPMIIRPSFWGAMYPGVAKWIQKRRKKTPDQKGQEKKGWNPATFFIWMAMLIGSQSINLMLLRGEWQVFTRKADSKIALLREIIEKLHRGEEVDVERVLGTGDEVQEREWKEGEL